jgi:thiol-disulfide isomerase/thioredoxin
MISNIAAEGRQRSAGKLSFLLITGLVTLVAGSAGAPAQQLPAEATDHLDRARAAMNRNQYQEAIGEFRRVLKTSNACVECYFQLVKAYQKLGAHKDALDAARKAAEFAPDDHWRAVAHDVIGVELSAMAGSARIHNQDAELEFRTALQFDPDHAAIYFNLGSELMKEMRDAEGISVLLEYLKRAPDGPEAKLARAMAENPRRARESFAPADFALVTKEGEYVTLDEIKGKVVLLDFWASWCKPCEEALPTLQHLSKRYARDQFVLVSISVDQDEQAWRNFMASHHMDWPQALDRDFKLRQMFGIKSYPSYVLIDTEGIMRSYVIGSGMQSAGELDDAVTKLIKNVRKVEKAMASNNPPPAPTFSVPVRLPPSSASALDSVPVIAEHPAMPAPTPTVADTRSPVTASGPPAPAPIAASSAIGAARPSQASDTTESLVVTSNPDGAEIYLDQNFFGNAPATLRLPAGKHNLRLTLPGYHAWTRDVTAQPGSEARLNATLTKSVPGTIQGRVLWNERPMAGIELSAGECVPNAPRSAPVATDPQGHYTIADGPDGRVCVNLRVGNNKVFWTTSGTFVDVVASKDTTAPDTYLCKLFDPLSPKAEEWVKDSRPTLKWSPYPEAVGYSVVVWHSAPTYVNVFRRGDREPRLDATSIKVDVDLAPGEYFWRVDAYNRAGHPIGCNYPVKFQIVGGASAER